MLERRHGLRASRTGRQFLVTVISLSTTGELVKVGERLHVEGCDDWGSNLRVRCVQAPVFKPLLSVGEYTTTGGVTVLYGGKGYMFHKCSNVAKKIDAWIQKELRDSQYRGCTIAYKEKQRVQHLHETERKQD